ncbi:MAG: hypothetical protein J6R31_04125 [Rikenellaceae bacterium]|nr:hypothetical protein [Rikenellaceae bacterium]
MIHIIRMTMKYFLNILIAAVLCCGFVACDDKGSEISEPIRTSVVTLSKSSVDLSYEEGSYSRLKVTVPRFGWKAECDADWLTITPNSTDVIGAVEVVILAKENTGAEPRQTEVVFSSGNVSRTLVVTQVGYGQEVNDVKHPDGNANKWMFEMLETWYLWNDLLKNTYPDYVCDYDDFLSNTLIPLKGNEMDGGRYEDGSRYLYSYVTRKASSRAGVGHSAFGFATLTAVNIDNNKVYLRVTSVNPDSPADRVGIMRGVYIGRVNGLDITVANWSSMYNRLLYPTTGSVSVTVMSSTEYGGEFSFNEDYTVTLSAANIGNHPVVASDIIEYGGRRVGYVAYNSFTRGPVDSSTEYDADLERVFETFETEGINELVVDLRYNGGGSVSSCQKLLSMIAPKEKLGQKAFTLRHNTSIEEQLGDDEKIIKLLENYSNVNMSRVYVITSDMTASASEMVIVGLRGLDVDVTVVGIDTEGKNVGMDVMGKHIDGYDYTFAPITFQIYNAKGFTDYSQGIRADYKVDEWEDLRSDGWKPLGDPEEVVLKMVLNLIDGSRAVAEPTRSSARPKGVEKIRFTDPQRSMGALIYADDNFNQK